MLVSILTSQLDWYLPQFSLGIQDCAEVAYHDSNDYRIHLQWAYDLLCGTFFSTKGSNGQQLIDSQVLRFDSTIVRRWVLIHSS